MSKVLSWPAAVTAATGSSLELTFGDLTGAFGARQKIQVNLG